MPEAVRRRLATVGEKLGASGADVKWVAEENLHITLKFLGYVEPDRMESVARAVERVVDGMHGFDMTLSGVGAFPKVSRPSVIWVGVTKGGEELKQLADRTEDALERIGFAREPRGFSAHVTLGRVKSPRGRDRLCKLIESAPEGRDEPVDSVKVGSVAVMKSDLYHSGPVYTVVKESDLG